MYLVLVVAEATPMFQIIQGGTIGYRDLAKITQAPRRRTILGLVSCDLRLCDRHQLRPCGQYKINKNGETFSQASVNTA
jgi:hypothetical protein